MRALQQRAEVLDAGRAGRRASAPTRVATGHYARVTRDAGGRLSPAAAAPTIARTRRTSSSRSRRRSSPARCSRSASMPKDDGRAHRARARPARRRQARQPGDLLRARRRLRGRRRPPAARPIGPASSSTRRAASSAATTACITSRSASGRGSGISAAEPLYVVTLDAGAQAGARSARAPRSSARALTASGVNWMAGTPPAGDDPGVEVQIRSRHAAAAARVDADRARPHVACEFDAPQSAITPGQAAVVSSAATRSSAAAGSTRHDRPAGVSRLSRGSVRRRGRPCSRSRRR